MRREGLIRWAASSIPLVLASDLPVRTASHTEAVFFTKEATIDDVARALLLTMRAAGFTCDEDALALIRPAARRRRARRLRSGGAA